MERKLEHIDHLFREGLGSYTETPPPSVWDALEERLDNKEKKRPGFFYRRYWFIILLAFFGIGGASFTAWRMAGNAAHSAIAMSADEKVMTSNTNVAPNTDGDATTATVNTAQNESVVKKDKHVSVAKVYTRSTHKKHTTVVKATSVSNNSSSILPEANNGLNASAKEEMVRTSAVNMDHALAMNTEASADAVPTKTTVIKYIVKNTKHNNITIAESEPVIVNVRESHVDNTISNPVEDDEEEMTFGSNQHHQASRTYASHSSKIVVRDNDRISSAKETKTTATAGSSTPVKVKRAVTTQSSVVELSSGDLTAKVKKQPKDNVTSIAKVEARDVAKSATVKQPVVTKEMAAAPVVNKIKKNTVVNAAEPVKEAVAKTTVEESKTIDASKTIASTNSIKETSTKPAPVNTYSSSLKTSAVKRTAKNKTAVQATVDEQSIATEVKATTTPVRRVTASNAIAEEITSTSKAKAAANKVAKKAAMKKVMQEPKEVTQSAAAVSPATEKSEETKVTKGAKPAQTPSGNSKVKLALGKSARAKATKVQLATPAKQADKLATAVNKEVKEKESTTAQRTGVAKHGKHKPSSAKTAVTAKDKVTEPVQAVTFSSKGTGRKAEPKQAIKETPAIKPDPIGNKPSVEQPASLVAQAKANDAAKIPATFKNDSVGAKPTVADTSNSHDIAKNDSPSAKKKFHFFGFEVGIKAGFEGGFGSGCAQKFVVTPFLERKISSKFSVLIQPGIKYAGLHSKALDGTQSFYNVDANSTQITDEKTLIVVHNNDTIWRVDETIRQQYDSVVKSYAAGGSYLEFELPLLLKYNITSKLSVYGGVNLSISKQVGIRENTWSQHMSKMGDTFFVTPSQPPAVSSVLQYSGTPLSGYSGPLYPAPKGNSLRLGYMLGFSYQFNKRWLADVLLQQGNAKANVQGGYNVNTALSATYYRFTIGYKLFQ